VAQKLQVSKLEKSLGMEIYATNSPGIGGKIKQNVDDFIVEEILVDGSKAEVDYRKVTTKAVLGSTSTKGQYLLCVLVKRNWDTFIAIQNIAQTLGISARQVQIAGIKDAKAVTAQHITIESMSIEDLSNFRVKDMEIVPVGYVKNKLSPYYLQGNSFRITIRNITQSKTKIRKRIMTTIAEINRLGGIPNFFGHQRFGTTRPITHLVGKAIVNGDLKKAALLFIAKPTSHEHPSSRQARRELRNTGDFEKALRIFPKQLRYERFMLKSLSENPTDFSDAFMRIPIRLRRIFVQSYQSYLFNRFLSARIKHGLSVTKSEIGDYVLSIERSGLPMPAMHKIVKLENQTKINKSIESGKVRLGLPLIGLKQPPSQGIQGEIECEILLEEAISMKNFKVAAMPEMSSKGELRPIVTPVKDFRVSEIFDDTIATSRRAAKIVFTLYRGSYATVVLRELMKARNPIQAGF
jgi:tRNA pseudouridine13 synthase